MVLTAVASGGFDVASSVMVYQYSDGEELHRPPPSSPSVCAVGGQSHVQCSSYYSLALHRQHTDSSAFHNFSASLGHAFLVSTPGYYVACVSASEKDAGSVLQDGVTVLRYQKKDDKDSRQCASGAAFSPAATAPMSPSPAATVPMSPSPAATATMSPPAATSV
jgi:hypothetical protein